jgi:hypothetical protein
MGLVELQQAITPADINWSALPLRDGLRDILPGPNSLLDFPAVDILIPVIASGNAIGAK